MIFWEKFLLYPEWGKCGVFGPKINIFDIFTKAGFSELVLDDRHLKLGASDWFGLLKKILFLGLTSTLFKKCSQDLYKICSVNFILNFLHSEISFLNLYILTSIKVGESYYFAILRETRTQNGLKWTWWKLFLGSKSTFLKFSLNLLISCF